MDFVSAINHLIQHGATDDMATDMIVGIPAENAWAVVDLRNPFSIAMAISRIDLTPAAVITSPERANLIGRTDYQLIESVLLDYMEKRPHSGQTVNIFDVIGTAEEAAPPTTEG